MSRRCADVSYTNGKSIGRLDEPSLRAHGPHHFRNDKAAGGNASAVTFPISADIACVLHYESATYTRWLKKYLELAARHGTDPNVFARVPFAFYRSSISTGALNTLCPPRPREVAFTVRSQVASLSSRVARLSWSVGPDELRSSPSGRTCPA